MNECEAGEMCPNGECFNMDGSYKCRCLPGYKQTPNQQICIGKSYGSATSAMSSLYMNMRLFYILPLVYKVLFEGVNYI